MKNTLKVYRAMHDMTQEDLAQAVQVTRQTINAMEKNKYAPSTVLALKIARHFKVPVESLFQLEDTD
ncbi:helix-turn-helix transcriptional regulator [Flavobacterium caeni]|uniref:Putative transcriptional regulator n=1 Tax=Flavobacterium caeni TaxID=490189 RepID=A0A1G5FCU7_9FLAO|nr:helix-turn-helix transcriptional regulator [Flavobacterium caeni]SCY36971.1 putative transcriptional regulator [Flavobacterium caeni]